MDLSQIVEDRNNEIKQLKSELAVHQQELARMNRLKEFHEKPNLPYITLQENCHAIMSTLKISGLNPPQLANIDQYIASLRAILDRCKHQL